VKDSGQDLGEAAALLHSDWMSDVLVAAPLNVNTFRRRCSCFSQVNIRKGSVLLTDGPLEQFVASIPLLPEAEQKHYTLKTPHLGYDHTRTAC
jgi:hypothetical protein